MSKAIRVLLAERNSLVGVGIRVTLTVEEDFMLVGEANDDYKLQELNRKLQPDVLIIDSGLPNFTLPKSIDYLRKYCPHSRILILACFDEFDLSIFNLSSVEGCVFKSEEPQTLVSAVRELAKGNTWYSQKIVEKFIRQKVAEPSQNGETTLTEREQQVLNLIAQGWDNARIAAELNLAQQTVRNYMSRIYAKLAVSSRSEAVIWAIKHSLEKQREKVQI